MQTTQWFSAGRLKKIAAITLTVLILPAVPVAALTWSTAWTSNFGQQGTVTVSATNNTAGASGPSTVTVDFGSSGGGKASGKFRATRSYTLGAGETRLSVVKTVSTLLRDNGVANAILVKVKRGRITISGNIKGIYDQASPSTITVSGA